MSRPDSYVPSTQEILGCLENMHIAQKLTYKLALFTGLRKCECKYLLENYTSLKVKFTPDFCKIYLQLYRGNKNSFITFIPTYLHDAILDGKLCSVDALDSFLKRNRKIPLKYARKWFYTQCLSVGVPESIIDYLQGRNSPSIGSRHYLGKEMLAEKEYREKILNTTKLINNLT
ncbi:MAG: integrase [Candidatus Woesearchaeota archaeon]